MICIDTNDFLCYNIALQGRRNCCVHEWYSPFSGNKKRGVFNISASYKGEQGLSIRCGLPRAERGGSIISLSLSVKPKRTHGRSKVILGILLQRGILDVSSATSALIIA